VNRVDPAPPQKTAGNTRYKKMQVRGGIRPKPQVRDGMQFRLLIRRIPPAVAGPVKAAAANTATLTGKSTRLMQISPLESEPPGRRHLPIKGVLDLCTTGYDTCGVSVFARNVSPRRIGASIVTSRRGRCWVRTRGPLRCKDWADETSRSRPGISDDDVVMVDVQIAVYEERIVFRIEHSGLVILTREPTNGIDRLPERDE